MMYLATNRILLEAMCGHVETMGGRRSRYRCGLCSGGETKPVVAPDDYQASGAPRISNPTIGKKRKSERKEKALTKTKRSQTMQMMNTT
jgi:hypothetical protein